jgi:hypothetical protein
LGTKKAKQTTASRFSEEEMVNAVDQWKISYDWFSADLDLELESTQFSGGARGKILIRKDSATLLTVRKFGVEIFRALITPDSLMAVERMSRRYYLGPIENEVLPDIGTTNYKTMELLLSAQYPFLDIEGNHIEMGESEYTLTIENSKGESTAVYGLRRDETLSPATLDLSENTQNMAQFKFYSPGTINGKMVHMGRDIIIDDGWDWPFTLSAKYQNIELDVPGNIKFSIPPSYERMD